MSYSPISLTHEQGLHLSVFSHLQHLKPCTSAREGAGPNAYYVKAAFTLLRENLMLVVTTENIAGYRVKETKGQVFGVVVRSRGLGGNLMAGLRSIVGGEIHEYTQLLEEARRHAVDRMVRNAKLMQANAIVMMRFDSAEIGQTMSEIVAYGTAVIVEPTA